MAKTSLNDLVTPLYELTQSMKGLKLKPQATNPLRFTSFCNQPTHVGELNQSNVVYWVDNEDSDDIHIRCKQCGDLSREQILNPTTVENTLVNESADLDKIKPTTKPVDCLPIDSITVDQRLQARMEKELDPQVVSEYAELMRDGVIFPPVVVFYDGQTRWLAEGFHRIAAAKQARFTSIAVTVIDGDFRAATLHSLGSNADHGKRRTNADKRHVVELMLNDPEWSSWSDREIGERCKVDHKTVGGMRALSLGKSPVREVTKERTYTTKHGTTATMRTGNIGKKQEPVKPTANVDCFKSPYGGAESGVIGSNDEPAESELQCYPYPVKAKSVEEKNYDHYLEISKTVGDLVFALGMLPKQITFLLGYNANNTEHWSVRRPPFGLDLVSESFEDYLLKPHREGIHLPSLSVLDKLLKLGSSEKRLQAGSDPQDFKKALEALNKEIPDYDKKVATTESNEMDKLKCELAYLKSKIRDVYFDKASIRLDGDDEIRFDELPESN